MKKNLAAIILLSANCLLLLLLPTFSFSQPITSIGHSSAFTGASGSSVTIAKPSGVQQNDFLLAHISGRVISGFALNAPAGWMLVRRINSGSQFGTHIFYKLAGASEPFSYTFTDSTGTALYDKLAVISVYRGADTLSPVNAENGAVISSPPYSAPSVATTVDSCMLITLFSDGNGSSWTSPSGMTEEYDTAAAQSSYVSVTGDYQLQATSGNTAAKTATATSSSVVTAEIIALAPIPPPPVVPPVADFSADTTSGCSPLVVSFTNLSSNATSYLWNFGNGNTSTLQNPSQLYINPGTYTVTLTVSNSVTSDTKTAYITVFSLPTVDFSATTTSGCLPFTVNFTDLSSGAVGIAKWEWDFGDAVTDTIDQNPVHTYTNGGIFTVTLIATDSNGCISGIVKNNYITVNNCSGTKEIENFSSISVYPNPNDGQFTIYNLQLETYNFEIYNVLGEKVYQYAIRNTQYAIDISSLPGGLYFLKLRSGFSSSQIKIIRY